MEKLGNFLWKIFSMTMVFICHIGTNVANAADEPKYYTTDHDPKLTDEKFIDTEDTAGRQTTTEVLCGEGYYLSSCGMAILGTNWLHGMSKKGNIKTPDFYSYNTNSSDSIHMENLRKFFEGNETIVYTKKLGNSYIESQATPEEYKIVRNQILSNFCTDANGILTSRECQRCPNNANVQASTVKQDSYDTGRLLWDSWNVHTIADCYMKEFEDTSGSYVYVPNNIGTQTASAGIACYYSVNVQGSSLFYK